jgi:hypothetical protein
MVGARSVVDRAGWVANDRHIADPREGAEVEVASGGEGAAALGLTGGGPFSRMACVAYATAPVQLRIAAASSAPIGVGLRTRLMWALLGCPAMLRRDPSLRCFGRWGCRT